MPEHRTDTAATPAPDDTLRERLAEVLADRFRSYATGHVSDHRYEIVDALLPTIRNHAGAELAQHRRMANLSDVVADATGEDLDVLEARAEKAEREIPLRAAMRVAADHMAECRECGIEHKPRPHPNGPRYADTWAAEDGHSYRSRNRTVADVLRNELEATDG